MISCSISFFCFSIAFGISKSWISCISSNSAPIRLLNKRNGYGSNCATRMGYGNGLLTRGP